MKLILDDNDAIALIESLVRECVALRTELATSRATADDALTRWQDVADQRGEKLSAIAKEHEARLLDAGRRIGALQMESDQRAIRIDELSAELVRRVDLAHQNAKKVMELAELADRRGQRIAELEDLGKAYAERLVAAAERLKNLEAELADVYAQKRTLQEECDKWRLRAEMMSATNGTSTDLKLAQAHIARLQQTIEHLSNEKAAALAGMSRALVVVTERNEELARKDKANDELTQEIKRLNACFDSESAKLNEALKEIDALHKRNALLDAMLREECERRCGRR